MDASTTLVVTAVPNSSEIASVREYLKGVTPLPIGARAKPVYRSKVDEVIYGRPSEMVLVVGFDSADSINGMFKSEEYAGFIPVRYKGYAEMNIQLTREMRGLEDGL